MVCGITLFHIFNSYFTTNKNIQPYYWCWIKRVCIRSSKSTKIPNSEPGSQIFLVVARDFDINFNGTLLRALACFEYHVWKTHTCAML